MRKFSIFALLSTQSFGFKTLMNNETPQCLFEHENLIEKLKDL